MNKKAYSLIEIIVVTAIVGLVIAVALQMRSGSAKADKDISGSEEYFNQKSRLDSFLRHDLRNSREIVRKGNNHYQLKVLNLEPATGKMSEIIVEYLLTGSSQRKVERREAGKTRQTFDFSRFAPERKVKLEIAFDS